MKSACIASINANFFNEIRDALLHIGYKGIFSDDRIQIADERQRLFTIYANDNDEESKRVIAELDGISDLIRTKGFEYGFLVECRWEDLFCAVVNALSASGLGGFLVIDNAGKSFEPRNLNPSEIQL